MDNLNEMQILAEVFALEDEFLEMSKRLNAARRGLSITNKIKNREERRVHKSRIMSNLNAMRRQIEQMIVDLTNTFGEPVKEGSEDLVEGAYEEGVRDGKNNRSNPRASGIYGPTVGDYTRGFNDGKKIAEKEQKERIDTHTNKLAPYLKMSVDMLQTKKAEIEKRRNQIGNTAQELRGDDYSPRRLTPEQKLVSDKAKAEYASLTGELHIIDDALRHLRKNETV